MPENSIYFTLKKESFPIYVEIIPSQQNDFSIPVLHMNHF